MITIPDNHFVGINNNRVSEDGIPLGFITPNGNDAAANKRKETVKTWARGYHSEKKEPTFQEVTNEPVDGFKMCQDVVHGSWGNRNIVWRLEDPRGYELEISSSNFANIVGCTTVIEGVIQEKCVWGRDGARNVLLPITSEPYREATEATTRTKNTIKVKDVPVGSGVTMVDGTTKIYAGHISILSYSLYENMDDGESIFGWVKRHIFIDAAGLYHAISSPKIHTINEKGSADVTQYVDDINNRLGKIRINHKCRSGTDKVIEYTSNKRGSVALVTANKSPKLPAVELEFRSITTKPHGNGERSVFFIHPNHPDDDSTMSHIPTLPTEREITKYRWYTNRATVDVEAKTVVFELSNHFRSYPSKRNYDLPTNTDFTQYNPRMLWVKYDGIERPVL